MVSEQGEEQNGDSKTPVSTPFLVVTVPTILGIIKIKIGNWLPASYILIISDILHITGIQQRPRSNVTQKEACLTHIIHC